ANAAAADTRDQRHVGDQAVHRAEHRGPQPPAGDVPMMVAVRLAAVRAVEAGPHPVRASALADISDDARLLVRRDLRRCGLWVAVGGKPGRRGPLVLSRRHRHLPGSPGGPAAEPVRAGAGSVTGTTSIFGCDTSQEAARPWPGRLEARGPEDSRPGPSGRAQA